MSNKGEYMEAQRARIKAKELAREESRMTITKACVASGKSIPTFRTDPVTARSMSSPSSRAIAERKAVVQRDIRHAISKLATDDLGEMPTAMREERRKETNAWLGQFTYEPAAMAKAMDKKLASNHAKIAYEMQFTQTGEPINPQYVFNAERQQILNEKQKPAPQPECQQPKPQSLFGRFLRWLTSDGDGIRPMSVHEMQQFNKGSK